ncbi:MAG: glycerophosphodiester phosphodiesterase [Oscillospiraceae bacterium]|nr:glycerophosphodiester phosphodiesterase [Oscillospiraceae bacterium]
MIENPVLTAVIMVLIIIFLVFACAFVYLTTPNKFRFFDMPAAYCHRGFHNDKLPENSIPAFKNAVEHGLGVELDVQPTKDGKIVVFHDLNAKRMCGADKLISEMTFEELSALRLKESEEHIPLFEDVLAVLKNVPLSCEIKTSGAGYNPDFLEGVYQMLKNYEGNYNVISFNPFVLEWFKKNHPEVIRGQLSAGRNHLGVKGFMGFALANLLTNYAAKPDFISYNFKDKSLGFALNRFYGTRLCCYTARSMDDVEEAAYKGFSTFVCEDFDVTEV